MHRAGMIAVVVIAACGAPPGARPAPAPVAPAPRVAEPPTPAPAPVAPGIRARIALDGGEAWIDVVLDETGGTRHACERTRADAASAEQAKACPRLEPIEQASCLVEQRHLQRRCDGARRRIGALQARLAGPPSPPDDARVPTCRALP